MKRQKQMRDTPTSITLKICEMIQLKSPIERLQMGSSMYETSKRLVTRAILENNPNISKKNFKQEFFLKFYGNDFNSKDREKILSHLNSLVDD
jgi:hypothetical protein